MKMMSLFYKKSSKKNLLQNWVTFWHPKKLFFCRLNSAVNFFSMIVCKKNDIIFICKMFNIINENKGGQVTLCQKEASFEGNRNFWSIGCPKSCQVKNISWFGRHLPRFLIWMKNKKSYVTLKSDNSTIWKIRVAGCLPFEMKQPMRMTGN